MKQLPFIQTILLLLWLSAVLLQGLFAQKRDKMLSLTNVLFAGANAALSAVLLFGFTSGMEIDPLALSLINDLKFLQSNLAFNAASATTWVVASFALFLYAYFVHLQRLHGEKKFVDLSDPALPLLALSLFVGIQSTDLLAFHLAWSGLTVATLLSLIKGMAKGISRYVVLALTGEVLFIAGMISFVFVLERSGMEKTLSVAALSPAQFSTSPPQGLEFSLCLLILGAFFRLRMIPAMQMTEEGADAGPFCFAISVVGNLVFANAFVKQISPLLLSYEGPWGALFRYAAFIPLLTMLWQSLLLLNERAPVRWVNIAGSIAVAQVLVVGLGGGTAAALVLTWGLIIALCGFYFGTSQKQEQSAMQKFFAGFFGLGLLGFPIGLLGWGKYLEYSNLFRVLSGYETLQWILVQGRILGDLIFGVSIWAIVRKSWKKTNSKKEEVHWAISLPLIFLSLSFLSGILSGHPFGILTSLDFHEFEFWSGLNNIATQSQSAASSITHELVDNSEVFIRIIVGALCLLPVLLTSFWFYRDEKSYQSRMDGLEAFFGKTLQRYSSKGGFSWALVISPLGSAFSRIIASAEELTFDHALGFVFRFPRKVFMMFTKYVEHIAIEQVIVDGVGNIIQNVSKAVRIAHTGRVQFYLVLAVAVFVVVAIRLSLKGL